MRRKIGALLAAVLVLLCAVPSFAADPADYRQPMQKAVAYLQENPPGPLHILLFEVSGEKPKSAAVTDMGIVVRETKGSFASMIRHSQTLLSVLASGYDPTNRDGVDLVRTLLSYEEPGREGAQGAAWALLALGSAPLELPQDTPYTVPELVSIITGAQTPEGYLPYQSGQGADLSTTALAVLALSHWKDEAGAQAFIGQALSWLATQQNADGSFSEFNPAEGISGNVFASSQATALAALAFQACGEPQDAALQSLLRFVQPSGGFSRQLGGPEEVAATEWALLALWSAVHRQDPFDLSQQYLSYQAPDVLQSFGGFAAKSLGICAIIYLILMLMQKRYERQHPQGTSDPSERFGPQEMQP